MTDRELTARLQELGLTKYQSSAYVAAIRAGQARPNDLVDMSDVPQGRIYDVVDDLEEMGLVEIRSRGTGKVVTAPSPEAVLEDLKRRRIDDITDRIDAISSELQHLHEGTDAGSGGYVTMASRRETAVRHVRSAIESAECWLNVSVPTDLYADIDGAVAAAVEDGVTVRLLLSGSDGEPDRSFPAGMAVRYRSAADTFVAADRAYGVYASEHPRAADQQYLITQEPTLVLLLQDYVESVWEASARVQTPASSPGCYLDPRRLIVDRRADLDAGVEPTVVVAGRRTDTHTEGVWRGTIVDYEISGPVETDFRLAPPTVAALVLETDEGTVTVGGWRATIEDVAATRIELESSDR